MYKVMFGPVKAAKFIGFVKDKDAAIDMIVGYANQKKIGAAQVNVEDRNGITVVDVGSKLNFGFAMEA